MLSRAAEWLDDESDGIELRALRPWKKPLSRMAYAMPCRCSHEPCTQTRLMLHSHHKARHLEADVERMADVLVLIAMLAERDPRPGDPYRALANIAHIARAALVGATPPE